jgi:hypothetical protein
MNGCCLYWRNRCGLCYSCWCWSNGGLRCWIIVRLLVSKPLVLEINAIYVGAMGAIAVKAVSVGEMGSGAI